jgi:hypothetical protein
VYVRAASFVVNVFLSSGMYIFVNAAESKELAVAIFWAAISRALRRFVRFVGVAAKSFVRFVVGWSSVVKERRLRLEAMGDIVFVRNSDIRGIGDSIVLKYEEEL